MLRFLLVKMKKLSKLIYDMDRVSSLSAPCRFVPKFESVRTQATDRFLPDFYPSQIFETPPPRACEQMSFVAYDKVVESSKY